jgi:hypothetical protein
MVTTILQGGLGNYLFQIGAASTLALFHDDIAIFDFESSVKVHQGIHTYKNNILRNVNIGKPIVDSILIEPRDFSYMKLVYSKNVLLDGYFQSSKYLHRAYMLDLFSIDSSTYDYIKLKYRDILENDNTVAVHVRHGDYLQKLNKFPIQDIEYYDTAFSYFPDATFVVFSDDIKWCKENFKHDKLIFIENEYDYIDLYLMSLCKHNIIANSSFSWWAAYLNTNSNKKVIAPKKWFGRDKKLKTENIYCDNWTII